MLSVRRKHEPGVRHEDEVSDDESSDGEASFQSQHGGSTSEVIVPADVTEVEESLKPEPSAVHLIGRGIYFIEDHNVAVCKGCEARVHNPARHAKTVHFVKLTSDLKERFRSFQLDDWKPDRTKTIKALPFVKVKDGFQCSKCDKCYLTPEGAECHKGDPDRVLRRVKVQSLLGRGGATTAVPVLEVKAEAPMDLKSCVAAVVEANTFFSADPKAHSFREISPFYTCTGWFKEQGNIDSFVGSQVHRLFDPPPGVDKDAWSKSLIRIFETSMAWTDSLPGSFHKLTQYRLLLGRNSKRQYAKSFSDVINFAVNLAENMPQNLPLPVTLPARFRLLANHVRESVNTKTVFALLESILSQRMKDSSLGVIQTILRASCLDTKSAALRDPRHLGPFFAHLMKLVRLTINVQAGVTSSSEGMAKLIAAEAALAASASLVDAAPVVLEEIPVLSALAIDVNLGPGAPLAAVDSGGMERITSDAVMAESPDLEDDADDDGPPAPATSGDSTEVFDEEGEEIEAEDDMEEELQEVQDKTDTKQSPDSKPDESEDLDDDPDLGREIQARAKYVNLNELFPFVEIVNVLFLARKHTEGRGPRFLEDPECKWKIFYNLKSIDLRCLGLAYSNALAKAKEHIEWLSCLGRPGSGSVDTSLRVTDLQESYDNDFIRHKDMKALSGGKLSWNPLLNAVLESEDEVRRVLSHRPTYDDPAPVFRKEFWKEYLQRHDDLQRCLQLLVHLGGGMSGRGTELATLRFRSAGDVRRHVFVHGDNVFIEPVWNKTKWKCDIKQFRFLEEEVSELLLRDFIFIRPFMQCIAQAHLYDEPSTLYLDRVFVSNGAAVDDRKLRASISRTLSDLGGLAMTFREIRHLVKFIFNKGDGTTDSSFVKNLFACLQFGHGVDVGSREYATSDRQHPQFNSKQFLGQMGVSASWWGLLRHLGNIGTEMTDPSVTPTGLVDEVAPTSAASEFSRSRSHGAQLLDSIRTGNLDGPITIQIFPQSVRARDHLLADNPLSLFARQALDAVTYDAVAADALGNVGGASECMLRKLIPGAKWRSGEQMEAVDYVLWSTASFMLVMPTGSGKSTTFFLCALQDPHLLTVVLTPTCALRDDIIARGKQFGVFPCSSRLSSCSAGLVVLTFAEVQTAKSTTANLSLLVYANKIKRIFVDEVHTLATEPYQDAASVLPVLLNYVPHVLMTATAPPRVVGHLQQRLFAGQTFPRIIRAISSDRPNLEYVVLNIRSADAGVKHIRTELGQLKAGEKAIVFVTSKDRVKALKSSLSDWKPAEYSSDMEAEERSRNMETWTREGVVMIATTALCSGIDFPSVRCVIMDGLPYSMEGFVQEAGRAGRDGKQSRVVVLFNKQFEESRVKFFSKRTSEDLKTVMGVIESAHCTRELLTLYMDGRRNHCRSGGGLIEVAECGKCKVAGAQEGRDSRQRGSTHDVEFAGTKRMSVGQRNLAGSDAVIGAAEEAGVEPELMDLTPETVEVDDLFMATPRSVRVIGRSSAWNRDEKNGETVASGTRSGVGLTRGGETGEHSENTEIGGMEDLAGRTGRSAAQRPVVDPSKGDTASVSDRTVRRGPAFEAINALYKDKMAQELAVFKHMEMRVSADCAICDSEEHHHAHCPLKNRGSCDYCFNVSVLEESEKHRHTHCPFAKYPQGCCAMCWLPLTRHCGVETGRNCKFFSARAWWIKSRSATLKNQGLNQRDLIAAYKEAISANGEVCTGLSAYFNEVVLLKIASTNLLK
jgi:superfamily II DNA helicase RecQ